MNFLNSGSRARPRAAEVAHGSMIAVAIMLLPTSAGAQAPASPDLRNLLTGMFGTPHGDANSANQLNRIFGALFPAETGSIDTTAISILAGYLNVAVLMIGGLLFAWNLAVGVLQSAHEGEVLGRRWSSMWAPLRVVFAVALLLPVPGLGGYNSIQAGVAWIVRGSTMMASELWGQGARLLISGELPIAGHAARLEGEVFKTVYRNQLCSWLANYQLEAAGSPARVSFDAVSGRNSIRLVSTIDGRQREICGAYRIPEPPAYIAAGQSASGPGAEQEFRNLHAEMLEIVIDGANRAISRQWPALLSNDRPVPDISADIAATLVRASARLADGNRRLIRQASGSGGDRSNARAAIERFIAGGCAGGAGRPGNSGSACRGEGWIGAGNWYMTIARLNSELLGLTNASISAEGSAYVAENRSRLHRQVVIEADTPGWFSQLFGRTDVNKYLHVEEADRIWSAANSSMEQATLKLASLGMGLSGRIVEDAAPAGATGFLGKIWRVGFADEIGALLTILSPSGFDRDPMVGLINMGNWFIDVAGALIFGGAAVSLLSGGFGTTIVFLIAAPMAAVGVSQSFIIPMLPFIYWILGIAGYFLLVAEAVVATTLWALMHFRLDGEGISGDAGRQGWLMLLALALTPALMIVGYFFGMVIFRVAAGLLDLGMHHAMGALVNASPIVGIFGLIAAGFLIVLSYVVIIERSFSLISEFPARILKWIGAAAGIDDGGGAQQFRRGGGAIATSVGTATRQLGRLAPRGLAARTPFRPGA